MRETPHGRNTTTLVNAIADASSEKTLDTGYRMMGQHQRISPIYVTISCAAVALVLGFSIGRMTNSVIATRSNIHTKPNMTRVFSDGSLSLYMGDDFDFKLFDSRSNMLVQREQEDHSNASNRINLLGISLGSNAEFNYDIRYDDAGGIHVEGLVLFMRKEKEIIDLFDFNADGQFDKRLHSVRSGKERFPEPTPQVWFENEWRDTQRISDLPNDRARLLDGSNVMFSNGTWQVITPPE